MIGAHGYDGDIGSLGIAVSASFGASWSDVGIVVALTGCAYATVFAAVRLAGRRTLAQMSAYDVLVTIALGTMLGTIALSPDVSLAEGLAAVATLLALQAIVGIVRRSLPVAQRITDFRPRTVVADGELCHSSSLFATQMTEEELRSQLRLRGVFDPSTVERAVLEPIGGVSVATRPAPDGRAPRSARQVLDAHLACRRRGDLEGDLRDNYASDVVLLSWEGVHRGHEGVRKLAGILRSYVPDGSYRYQQFLVDGDFGMLRWSARADDVELHDGADSYVVRDGRIVAQSIHYSSQLLQ